VNNVLLINGFGEAIAATPYPNLVSFRRHQTERILSQNSFPKSPLKQSDCYRNGVHTGCHRSATSREPRTWQSFDDGLLASSRIKSEPRLNRPPFTVAVCNQRRINVDRASFVDRVVMVMAAECRTESLKRRFCAWFSSMVPKASSSGRCFSQFDRKTDCYRNGIKGTWLTPWDGSDAISKSEKPVNTRPLPFTVAVCGTQTRHGVSVNKYQADSQKCGRSVKALSGERPLSRSIWQKPGIGMAAVSPVPLRESDQEKETSTYRSDQGKAIGMPKWNNL